MLRHLLTPIFAVALLISATPDNALAAARIALVIGNSDYTNIARLRNPGNDARLMASALRDVGFDVVTAFDVDERAMGRAVSRFGQALRAAGRDAVGLFYYAGHGAQYRGQNYLIPLGTQIEHAVDLKHEAIEVSDVLAQMEEAANELNIVILDACRDNPYTDTRGGTRGLARIESLHGSLVAYSAEPGSVAQDGNGPNSPYASALALALREPGLTIEQVFKRVRVSVHSQTGGQQTPMEESLLTTEFSFTTATVSPSSPTSGQQPAPEPPASAPNSDQQTPADIYARIASALAGNYSKAGILAAKRYSQWPAISAAPFVSATHGGRYVNVFANRIAQNTYRQFEHVRRMPIGSMIAMDSFAVTDGGAIAHGPLLTMERMTSGFNPATSDWRYAMVMPDGTLYGITGGKNSTSMQFCHDCHGAAEENDMMFFPPVGHRRTN